MVNIIVDFEKEYIGAIAYQGESNKASLVFAIPSSFVGYDFVNAEFEIPDGTKVVKSNLHPINNLLSVPITQDITAKTGVVSIQLVCYDSENSVIAKSPVILSHVQDSVDGCEIPSAVEQAVEMAHTHANKTILDNFSTSTAYPFTFLEYAGHAVPQFQINDVAPTTEGGSDYYLNWINPNVWYRFGSADSPVTSISIYQLQSVDSSVAEEYVVEFWTGATAPSPVIFPSDVEWPDGSEPTWAANKHYQVSIVGNMGLYAETDFGEEE